VISGLPAGLLGAGALFLVSSSFSSPALSAGDGASALDRYREVLDRPLFSPSRRPAAASLEPTGATEGEVPTLQGIVVSPRQKFALFAGASEADALRVSEGETIGRWTVAKIAANHVTLTAPDGAPVEISLNAQQTGTEKK
jgi:hypothetical protein